MNEDCLTMISYMNHNEKEKGHLPQLPGGKYLS